MDTRRRLRWTAVVAAACWAAGTVPPVPGAIWPQAALAAPPIQVVVDDVPLVLTPAPVILDGILYLPLRPLIVHFQAAMTSENGAIVVRRNDGATFLLRPGRLEVWSDDIAWAVAEAPVRVANGAIMVPRGMVEAVFGVLTVWSEEERVLQIATPRPFRTESTRKPESPTSSPGSAPTFTPEFQLTTAPLVASGFVSFGLAVGGTSTSAVSRMQFASYEGEERTEGTVEMSARPGSFAAAGAVRRRTASSVLTLGAFVFDDSPLTLYQQGISGALYEGPWGEHNDRVVAGSLIDSSSTLYGLIAKQRDSDPAVLSTGLMMSTGLFYDPDAGVGIARVRMEHPIGDLGAFGEYAWGTSPAGSAGAFRVGLTRSSPSLTATLSYLMLSADYPTIGNASLFSGREGPLVELAYRPTPRWSVLGSAAVLSGAPSGLPDRVTYGLVAGYRASTAVGVTAELRNTEDTTGGVRTRTTSAAGAVSYAVGRWGFVTGASYSITADLLAGTSSSTSTFSLRAGYTLSSGLPAWAEFSQSVGATEGWSTAGGFGFRLSPSLDFTAVGRYTVNTLPAASTESLYEVGVGTPLSTGASLIVGYGVKYTSASPDPISYVTLQYGFPVQFYGVARVGRVEGVIYTDANGDGRRDPEEPGVAGVVVRLDDRSAAISSDAGLVTVDGVREGRYRLVLDEATVPTSLVAAQAEQTVEVVVGEVTRIEFALVPGAAVRGVVFIDENGNGVRDAQENGLEGVAVTLQPTGGARTSEADGSFEFLHLPPGAYRVAVDPRALPADLAGRDSAGYTVVLQAGGTAIVNIPLASTKPVIKKTFP